MLDSPSAALLVAEARAALEGGLAAGFPQKVATNALGIAQRELEEGPALAEAELARLRVLLDADGPLDELNTRLAERIAAGAIALNDGALVDHLIRTTIAKVSIDQPGYASFRAWREGGRTPD